MNSSVKVLFLRFLRRFEAYFDADVLKDKLFIFKQTPK